MLDKLHLNGPETIPESCFSSFPKSQVAKLRDGQYEFAYRVNFDSLKALTIKTGAFWGHVSPSSIEANPSHWQSWKELLRAFNEFIDPTLLTIDRIDHAVDLPIPFEKVHECVRVRSKQRSKRLKEAEDYSRGQLTGAYYGEKPEVICIYDKAYQLSKGRFKPLPGAEIGVRTRFEVRQFHRKVAFPKITDIHNYLEVNPFGKIEFCELRAHESDSKAMNLKELLERDGLHTLHHKLNKSNNFDRTYRKYFELRNIDQELHEKHREELRIFFEQ